MAGRTAPMRNYLDTCTEQTARHLGRLHMTVLDYVCDRIEKGATLADLTAELRTHCLPETHARRHIGSSWIAKYLRRLHPDTDARLAEAERVRCQRRTDAA